MEGGREGVRGNNAGNFQWLTSENSLDEAMQLFLGFPDLGMCSMPCFDSMFVFKYVYISIVRVLLRGLGMSD